MTRTRTRAALAIAAAAAGAAVVARSRRYDRERERAAGRLLEATYRSLGDIGAVDEVRIMPIIERHSSRPDLLGEPGLSYVITAGAETVLLDVGLNREQRGRRVLAANVEALGVNLDRLSAVVISHLHVDHVGGIKAVRARSFTLGPETTTLRGIPAFTPVDMTHDRADVRVTNGPTVIAPGVALLPPLPAVLFWMGQVEEQALVVNVRGLGLVLVSGCGHPGIASMLALTERLLDVPVHAVVGGLHLPVHPVGTYWVPATVAAQRPPWNPLGDRDVDEAIEQVRLRHPAVVAVSGHDTTPSALARFGDALGSTFSEVRVGEEIRITAPSPASTS